MAFCIRDYHEMRRARAHMVRCHHESGNNKAASLLRLLRFKVSNRQVYQKEQTCEGILKCLRPVTLHMASLGLWTLPFCSLARISPTFCSVASLPIESRPCFPRMASQRSGSSSPSSGDPYNSEKAGASCWSPRTWHMDGNFGLRAEDAAPRSFAPRDSGRPNRVRRRQEARRVGPALCRLKYNPAKEPTQASQTRLVRSALRQHAGLVLRI